MISEPVEGFRAVFIDWVITLTVAVGIKEIIQLQGAVVSHEGHHVSHIPAFRRGIETVFHRLIRLIRDRFGVAALRILLRRSQCKISFGVRRGARTAAAGRQEQGKNQKDGNPILLHCEHTFLI